MKNRSGPRTVQKNQSSNAVYIRDSGWPRPARSVLRDRPQMGNPVTSYSQQMQKSRAEYTCQNAAATPAITRMNSTHQPNTMARQVPRFTLVKQENPMPASAIVQMLNASAYIAAE